MEKVLLLDAFQLMGSFIIPSSWSTMATSELLKSTIFNFGFSLTLEFPQHSIFLSCFSIWSLSETTCFQSSLSIMASFEVWRNTNMFNPWGLLFVSFLCVSLFWFFVGLPVVCWTVRLWMYSIFLVHCDNDSSNCFLINFVISLCYRTEQFRWQLVHRHI